jgi:hypothetical protein
LVDGIWACQDAGESIMLPLENRTKEPIIIEQGEMVAKAAILDNSNVVIE